MSDAFNSTSTSHRSGYGADAERTDRIVAWIEKYPDTTLASGEAQLLVRRIRELEAQFRGMVP
jgi:hypothetical protein